jgi:hypothetical protein
MAISLDDALVKLHRVRRLLDHDQGRIARRNARRKVLGALRAVRMAVDANYPAIAKSCPLVDPVDSAAAKMTWREFEYRVIKHVTRAWDLQMARAFNEWISAQDGHPAKPIVFDIRAGTKSLLGQHCRDRIRLRPDLCDAVKWRTLLHELAHYKVHGHRRAFTLELCRMYKLWRTFFREQRAAARRSPADSAIGDAPKHASDV